MHTKPYPLTFQPIYKPKVWGGRSLERLGRSLPGGGDTLIGESWEVADLAESSVTGGGGAAERSVIANGPLAGRTLHDVLTGSDGGAWLGRLGLTPDGGFPLLVKYLDARQNLSVQVHPSPDYTRAHAGAHLKSEAWCIIDAEPGAVIYKGVRQGVTPQQFRAAIEGGSEQAVTDLLIAVPAKVGGCHYLPSGTCHALGAGVLVAEAQTPSDTTFRVFDWNRQPPRELHIEQAMSCIDFGPPDVARYEQRSHVAGMFTTVSRLCLCEHFRIEKVRMVESYEQELPYDQPAVWLVQQGRGSVTPSGKDTDAVTFQPGQTLLMPAGMEDPRVKIEEDAVWLEFTFPQALPEEVA